MAKSNINIIPTAYPDVVALLKSDALRAVEEPLAAHLGLPVLRDDSVTMTSLIQAEMSVSGLTAAQIEQLLLDRRDELIRLWLRYVEDQREMADKEVPQSARRSTS